MTPHLSTGWMDADGAVQLLLGHPTFHGCAEALCHLSSIWTQVVEPNDSILQCVIVTVADVTHLAQQELKLLLSLGSEMCEQCNSRNNLTLSSLLQMSLA